MSYTYTLFAVTALSLICCAGSLAGPHPGLRVAMAQIRVEDGDVLGNMQRAEGAVRQSAAQGADFVCIPEAADYGWLYESARRDAYPIPGTYTKLLSRLAKELNVWVSAGCLEKDGEKTYNSAVIIDRKGKIVLKHRKINTLKNLTKKLYDPGDPDSLKVVDTEFGRIGMTICADNFSIKNPKRIAEQGAWLLITPHGFAAKSGDLRSNANGYQEHIQNIGKQTGMWVVGTDTVLGKVAAGQWKGWWHTGCSTIASPKGEAAAVAKFLHPDLVVFDIPGEK
ncbi:MAG: carbon-nitrogen hydrolase family protein [Armatimonadota bacterium]|nr:carbon-nitrogen hydrolase family protein [Armatimonadota bacterium]